MNRTNEYFKLIELTSIAQKKTQLLEKKNTFNEIENILSFLEKQNSLDNFVMEQKIKKIKHLISELNKNYSPENESQKTHLKNVLEITDNRIKKYLIRINKLSKQKNHLLVEDNRRRENFMVNLEQEQAFAEKTEQKEDVLKKRMVTQLNELGQIVSDISLHVSLQGEEIMRIDEVVNESSNFMKEAAYEINKTWENVSDQRKRFIKFFAFWILLAIILWLWKR